MYGFTNAMTYCVIDHFALANLYASPDPAPIELTGPASQ